MKTCSYVHILSKYLVSILQVNNRHNADTYPNNLITTKCLNTAVMLITLLIGNKQLKTIQYCDVQNTRDRHESNSENNLQILNNLNKQLLNKSLNHNMFYIMLTDSTLYNDNNDSIYFPGHVFIIEKINNDEYYLYQSYIGEYDLNEFLNVRKCRKYTNKDMIYILDNLSKLSNVNNKWDNNMITFWKRFTHVDSTKFNGFNTHGIYVCYKKFSSKCVMKNTLKYVDKSLEKMKINGKMNKNHYDFFDSYYLSVKGKSINDLMRDYLELRKYLNKAMKFWEK
jgi:hypothetical protein